MKRFLIWLAWIPCLLWGQGTFAPAAGQPGSTAIAADSSVIRAWAQSGKVFRGWLDRGQKSLGRATFGDSSAISGSADGNVVSLGDSGYAEIYCTPPLQNEAGADFAVFENSFSDTYLELAFVEVSSNGHDFVRFPAVSLTDSTMQVSTFGSSRAEDIHLLAGKYRGLFGVPFDLDSLPHNANLNPDSITVIRLVDVTGAVGKSYTTRDALGNPVNDPYPTAFAAGGFDLDAVAFLHPQKVGLAAPGIASAKVFPTPTQGFLQCSKALYHLKIIDLKGKIVLRQAEVVRSLAVHHLPKGHYWLHALDRNYKKVKQRIVIQ